MILPLEMFIQIGNTTLDNKLLLRLNGFMQGQARRECSMIGLLLAMRKRLLRFAESLIALSKAILEQASNNLETIMPDLLTYLLTYLLT
ncbi:hypothetical protein B1F79_04660, partial [Coxiella-like endosymbiont of Rhipicephalus sanguineus]|uniref:hypothetical protein n=1 Tax=Coxiella-like endosymbiont of Rhipicephalus sanguineus TaxID=1955402 RepID=UPI00203C1989